MSDDIVERLRKEPVARDLKVCEDAANYILILRGMMNYWYMRWHALETTNVDMPQ